MAVTVVLVLSGCGGSAGSGLAGGPDDPDRHVKDASSEVKCDKELRVDVIDNGAAPRHPMVMNLAVGQKESVRSVVDVTSSSEATENDDPSKNSTVASGLTADVLATVDEVSADAIKVTSRYENLIATTPVGEAAVAELKDKVTRTFFSPKGRLIDNDGAKAQTEQQFTAFITPFPDGDVGAGARWQAWSPLDAGGIKMCFLSTYTLNKFDGKAYELTGDTTIVVDTGTTQQEKFGITITVESRGGKGTGTLRTVGDLNSFYPESGETTSDIKFTVASSAQALGAGEFVLTTDQSVKSTFTRLGG